MSKHLDYDWLRQKYEVEKLTVAEIGEICDRSPHTICYHIRKAGFETRHTKSPRSLYKDPDWLREQYVDNRKTLKEIAEECNSSISTISYNLKKHNIETRKSESRIDGDKKYCEICNSWLDLNQFHKKKNSVDGLWHYCNQCYQEKYRKTRKEYRNKPEVKEKMRKSSVECKRRILAIVPGRINQRMSSSIYNSLKGNKKGRHWGDLVRYTVDELREHLESQFEDWMNWGNWGKINIKKGHGI